MAEGHRKAKTVAALPEIPDKLYFRIGEVARLLDLETYVLRFWETEFPQLKPNKGGTGQRLYRRRDVEMALRIRSLLYDEGYTIPGARQFLKGEMRDGDARNGNARNGDARNGDARQKAEATAAQLRPIAVPAAAPVAQPEMRSAGTASALHLHRLRSELNEIASLLSRPAPGQRRAGKPEHRGLHVAHQRRRHDDPPAHATLFPIDSDK